MKLTRQLLIFDLDGVLVDETKIMHYDSLIHSISKYNPKFELTSEMQAVMETAMTSKTKINRMIELGAPIDRDTILQIINYKASITSRVIDNLEINDKLVSVLSQLHEHSNLAVASNSHSDTVDRIIHQVGLGKIISFTIGNDLVRNTKPHPEIFWACMSHFGYLPNESVVFEDSPQGHEAAIASGARLEKVKDSNHLITILEEKYV